LRIGAGEHEVQAILAPEKDAVIALLFLREPVADVEPTPIYRASDEARMPVVIVGHGAAAGFGGAPIARDGRKRAAINTIDRVDAASLAMRIKGPDDASDMQGAAGPDDEGAPAFIEAKGRLFVVGVAHGSRGGGVPKVGDWDVYTRVSAYASWIDEAMFKAAAEEAAATTKVKPR
jgi:hypothetical protein